MLRRTLMDRVHGPLAGRISLRPAAVAGEPLLYRIYASARGEELQLVNWDPGQKTAFLEMQFGAQSAFYRQRFPDSGYEVILVNDEPVGRLFLHLDLDEIRLVDIGLLSEHRNQGIGAALIAAILDEAAEAGKPVRLHVEVSNRAQRLYQRLGFLPIGARNLHLEMEFVPNISEKGCGL